MSQNGIQRSFPAARPSTDEYGRVRLGEREICARLYVDPDLDVSRITVDTENANRYNGAIEKLYLDWDPIQQLEEIEESPEEWHHRNQQIWLMPQEYKDKIGRAHV